MSDNMPDFDNMSQEEIMAWMETLAKRQGASEGFTTAADMDIAEVDPSTAIINEPEGGYVPYGQERTQPVKPAAPAPVTPPPAAQKPAAPPAAAAPPAPRPTTVPPAQPPQPQVRPLTPPPSAQQKPPAPPQSAPSARPAAPRAAQQPPQRTPTPPPTQQRPSMPPQSAPPARPAVPPAAQQPPQRTPPPPPTQQRPPTPLPSAPPARPAVPPAAQQPPQRTPTPTPPVQQRPPAPPTPTAPAPRATVQPPAPPPEAPAAQPPVDEGALAWLESLAADQGDELFNLDLSDLPSADAAATPAASVNPMTWLEDLARSQVAEPSLERLGADDDDDEEESEKLDPYAQGVNPIEWLETLAKRQGAKEEELTTSASMNIPAPAEAEVEGDDYQPFSFDTPPARRAPEPAAAENPADWLNSLAGAQGYSEEGVLATQKPEESDEAEALPDAMSMSTIEDAISQGTVTREQMQFFLEQQADQLAQEPELVYEEVEDDGPLAPAELPDWLSELRPPAPQAAPAATQPIDALFEAPPVAEMPDWLRQDLLGGDDSQSPDIDSIFQPEEDSQIIEPVQQVSAPAPYEIEVDTNDPWVEAFDEEYAQGGMADINAVPAWYEQNLSDPARIAAVEGQSAEVEDVNALEDAPLPEENGLTLGQPEAVPMWVTGFEPAEEQEPATSTNVFEEMPDWLREVEANVAPEDVPDWLVETIGSPEEAETIFMEPVQQIVVEPPKPTPVAPPPPRAASTPVAKPAPMPAPAARVIPTGEAAAVIERARDKEQSGDLEGALSEYEAMIRGSSALDAVVEELSLLVKSYKTTPAVYRVLGDGLMRQGKLQAALNTYREALNQL